MNEILVNEDGSRVFIDEKGNKFPIEGQLIISDPLHRIFLYDTDSINIIDRKARCPSKRKKTN